MTLRVLAAGLLAVSLLCAGSKKPVTATNENESVAITATPVLDREAIKQLLGSDLDGHFILMQVQVTPKFGKEIAIQRDDFLLRTDKDGERTTPFVPSQIAGRGALVISQTAGGGGGFGAETGPMWGGYPGGYPGPMGGPPVMMPGGVGVGGGGGEGESGAKATVQSGSKDKESPLLKVLAAKMLPDKKTDQPVSGLLYFPMEKQKQKDLELIYTSPTGKLSLRFK